MNYFFLSKRLNYIILTFLESTSFFKYQLIDFLSNKEITNVSEKFIKKLPLVLRPLFLSLLLKYNLNELGISKLFFHKLIFKGNSKFLGNLLKILKIKFR